MHETKQSENKPHSFLGRELYTFLEFDEAPMFL